MIARNFRPGVFPTEQDELFGGRVRFGFGFQFIQSILGQHDFARVDRGENGHYSIKAFFRGYTKLPGGQIHPRSVDTGFVPRYSEYEMVFFFRELVLVGCGAWCDDASEGSFDQLSGLRRFHLIADGNLHARFQYLADIAIRRMKRNTGHRIVVPLGQSNTQQLGPDFCILIK